MQTTPKHTKESIRAKLATSDNWMTRGMVAIFKMQTIDEQATDQTREENGVGFTGCDAFILSQFAKQVIDWQEGRSDFRSPLSPKQTALARRKMVKYAGQLAKIANGKINVPTLGHAPEVA